MLAIHNHTGYYDRFSGAANAFAKLSKCQQFTTNKCLLIALHALQTLLQSYQNVSNSQPYQVLMIKEVGCKRFCKVIKMLAIHNCCIANKQFILAANAFAKLSKCQQFTTPVKLLFLKAQLQTLLQSYQNVSNSQLN